MAKGEEGFQVSGETPGDKRPIPPRGVLTHCNEAQQKGHQNGTRVDLAQLDLLPLPGILI